MHVHIDDGRAFLERTNAKYDLIILALPDSLTLVSGASDLRLESYLFTRQAFEAARDHLTPDGAFAMYNYYRKSWLVDRFAGDLDDLYGHAPCMTTFKRNAAVLVAGMTRPTSPASRPGSRAAPSRRPRPTTTRSRICCTGRSPRSIWAPWVRSCW
ncbi:hypothetical protein WKI71_42210 [Streptomyces sp. MS1.AVA.1]|uniref:PABS domain-containing protein n=1 Tax=Streptomyces machairae TaxID=3134109 RepID=A0ABU8UUI0_9ACTN